MKKKNMSLTHFFYGCIAGTLFSSTLFFITHYAGSLHRGASHLHSQLLWRRHLLYPDQGAYDEDGILQPKKSFLLPVVVSSLSEAIPTYRTVQKTWGQTIPEWFIIVGGAASDAKWLEKEEGLLQHLVITKKCLDISHSSLSSAENIFCLMSAINQAFIFKYDWFVFVPSTTYLAINRLSDFLAKLDPNRSFYVGRPSDSCSEERQSFMCESCVAHCSMENGVVLSRASLQDISPHLSWCLQEKPSNELRPMNNRRREGEEEMEGGGDVALGCCMKKVLDISCSDSILATQVSRAGYRILMGEGSDL